MPRSYWSTLQELKGAALDRFILRAQGKTWDGVPVPHVGLADLSNAAIANFRKLATASGRLERKLLDETYPIPYDALREAVLNALIHRDYALPHRSKSKFLRIV